MGYDISFTASDATTQGFKFNSGVFNVGGSAGTNWLVLALIALAAVGLWWIYGD